MPGFEWHSGGHTNQFVPFFAKGSSAELFKERAINTDTIHGQYLDNTDIANTIFTLLKQR
jgi:alkaline phosphatase